MPGAQFQALIAAGASKPVTAAFLGGSTVGPGVSNSIAVSFGAQPDDFYVVAVYAFGANVNVSSCSIAGVAATILDQPFASFSGATMAIALVPAGTASGNIIFNTGANNGEGLIAAYRMDGLRRATPASISTAFSTTFNVAANSAIIGVASAFGSGAQSVSWSGIAADAAGYVSAAGGAAGHANVTSPNPSDTITATVTGATNGSACVVAVFSP